MLISTVNRANVYFWRGRVGRAWFAINRDKAASPDDLTPTVLKELSTKIAPILLKIFAKSLHSHIVPTD